MPISSLFPLTLNKLAKLTAILTITCLTSNPLQAQDAEALLNELRACSDIPSVTERIDCFDLLTNESISSPQQDLETSMETTLQINTPAPSTPVAAPIIQSPSLNSTTASPVARQAEIAPNTTAFIEDEFGWQDAVEVEAKQEEEIITSIVELEQLRPRKSLFTLANGQVWRQRNIELYHLREGYEVRIYRSGWGINSFRLTSSRLGGYIPVERIR